jgi:DNA polymerase III delta subunit
MGITSKSSEKKKATTIVIPIYPIRTESAPQVFQQCQKSLGKSLQKTAEPPLHWMDLGPAC